MSITQITPLAQPDIYTVMHEYISIFSTPILPSDNIIIGWQNRSYLPLNTNEYAVISIIDTRRRGTNVQDWSKDPDSEEKLTVKELELVECSIQIDFCSDNNNAQQRAQTIELVTRSQLGVKFFKLYGIAPLYADGIRDISYVDQSKQFVRRFMTTVHICYWTGVSTALDAITDFSLHIENVDVEHPVH